MVNASLGKKQHPISKITREKWSGALAQAVKHLPSKHEAPSLNPSTAKENSEQKAWIDISAKKDT
jgi:hypothetical protein